MKVERREVRRFANVEQHRSVASPLDDVVDVEHRRGRVVEELVILPIPASVELEVGRPVELSLGDDRDELVLAHRLQRVVPEALLADGRARLGGQLLAARRPGAVGWEHPGRVGEVEELVVQRAVELPGQGVGRERRVAGSEQVGAADVAHEQRVTGQHAVRHDVVGVLVHHDADRLRGVPGRREDLERDVAEREAVAVAQRSIGNSTAAPSPYDTTAPVSAASSRWPLRKSAWMCVSMTRSIVTPSDGRLGEVVGDVAAGVDHHRATSGLVADQIRRV